MFEGESEVEGILSHLLELIYAAPANEASDGENNFERKLEASEAYRESLDNLRTRMALRLKEGFGEAKYIVGVGNSCDLLGLNRERMFCSLSKLLIYKTGNLIYIRNSMPSRFKPKG